MFGSGKFGIRVRIWVSVKFVFSIFRTQKGICHTGRVHMHFRCMRLCERVFTAL